MYFSLLKHALFLGSAGSATTLPLVFSLGTNAFIEGGAPDSKLMSDVSEAILPQNQSNRELVKAVTLNKGRNLSEFKTISRKDRKINSVDELIKKESENREEDKNYRDFLRYFWEILRRTLWVDEINSIPWIHSVQATLPSHKVGNLTNYITNKNLPVNKVEVGVEFGKEAVKKLREWGDRWGTRHASSVTTGIRKGMEEAFLRFVDSNWNLDTALLTKDLNINKLAKVSLVISPSSQGEYPIYTVRFTREYGGQTYHLDSIFNSKIGENQLYIPHVWTGQEFYTANGEQGASKKYIGGKVNSNNVFDREFANMFSSPTSLHKQLTVIGECLVNYSTCGAIFPMSSYYTLPSNLKDKPLNRIHPLSDAYWRVNEKWSFNTPAFPLT